MFARIRKHNAHPVFKAKKKSIAGKDVLDKLNAFLNAAQAEPVYFLTRLWDDQQQAVTYKELREAIENGYMSEASLQAWQQDYAMFVNTSLKPIWQDAMKAANDALEAAHPDFYFDPMAPAAQKWVSTHGAQFVVNMGDEQRKAISGLISRSLSGSWTVDELSRAIRPCIGLTNAQAQANLNYYENIKATMKASHPDMTDAAVKKYAQDKAIKYSQKQQRYRAHSIATTELAYAYNNGAHEGTKQAQAQGYLGKMTKAWSTAADELVCPVCGLLDGVEVDMDDNFDSVGISVPPAHTWCRCACAYNEITAQNQLITPPAAVQPAPDQVIDPTIYPKEPDIPEVMKTIPQPKGLQFQGQANLGGTGKMELYEDEDGTPWLFKPAQSKSGTPESFRAYSQEAGFRVQSIIDPDTAVPISVGNSPTGVFGAFQKQIITKSYSPNLKALQGDGEVIPGDLIPQLQRENITDFLLANYDSHGGNFVFDDAGRLIGVDKEQAFKYLSKAPKTPNISYHPNASYGETEPVYNTLFRRFTTNETDINLQDALPYIKRVEAIPDSEYREIFRKYAEEVTSGNKAAAESLLDDIVERKQNIRESYRAFNSDLLTVRTGTKQSFIWADEAANHMNQPIDAVLHSVESLKHMSVAELKQLGKLKKIPYYNNMNTRQLITSLSDPSKAPAMSAEVREMLKNNALARAARAQAKPAHSVIGVEELLGDLNRIPDSALGIPFRLDGDKVEGLTATARLMIFEDRTAYELSGKLTENTWKRTLSKMKSSGQMEPFTFFEKNNLKGIDNAYLKDSRVLENLNLKCYRIQHGDSILEVFYENSVVTERRTFHGYFRIISTKSSNPAADASEIKELLHMADLDNLIVNPTAAEEALFGKIRVLWQHAPERMNELKGLTGQNLSTKIDEIAKDKNLDLSKIANFKNKKVIDGYSTYIDESVEAEYQAAGLRYVWHGTDHADHIVSMIKGPGLLSNNERLKAGYLKAGHSPERDIETGGSDNVFTRIGIDFSSGSSKRFSDSYGGGYYHILIDPKEMNRTDWYAYTSDKFGSTEDLNMDHRKDGISFIKSVASFYEKNNEIMFRHGISNESFIGIACEKKIYRDELLKQLKSENIFTINGIPVDQFVTVRTTI